MSHIFTTYLVLYKYVALYAYSYGLLKIGPAQKPLTRVQLECNSYSLTGINVNMWTQPNSASEHRHQLTGADDAAEHMRTQPGTQILHFQRLISGLCCTRSCGGERSAISLNTALYTWHDIRSKTQCITYTGILLFWPSSHLYRYISCTGRYTALAGNHGRLDSAWYISMYHTCISATVGLAKLRLRCFHVSRAVPSVMWNNKPAFSLTLVSIVVPFTHRLAVIL